MITTPVGFMKNTTPPFNQFSLDLGGVTNKYATIPDNTEFDLSAGFAFGAWIYLADDFNSSSPLSMPIFGMLESGNEQMTISFTGTDNSRSPKGAVYFKLEQGGGLLYATTTQVSWTKETWNHLVGSYSLATRTGEIYVNGILAGSDGLDTIDLAQIDTDFEIGRSKLEQVGGSPFRYFKGSIDGIAMFDTYLNAAKVLEWKNIKDGDLSKHSLFSNVAMWLRCGDHPDDDLTPVTGQITEVQNNQHAEPFAMVGDEFKLNVHN